MLVGGITASADGSSTSAPQNSALTKTERAKRVERERHSGSPLSYLMPLSTLQSARITKDLFFIVSARAFVLLQRSIADICPFNSLGFVV